MAPVACGTLIFSNFWNSHGIQNVHTAHCINVI